MRFRLTLTLMLLSVVLETAVFADPVIAPEPALPAVTRGQEVLVHGKDFPPPDEKGGYQVILSTGKPDDTISLPAKWIDTNTFTFKLPLEKEKLPADRYLVNVRMAGKELQVPGDLRIIPDALAPVHLDAIYPVTAYPTDNAGSDFDISGENLAAIPQDNSIIVVGRGPVPVGDAKECDEFKRTGQFKKTCIFVEPGLETRKLHVVNFPRGRYDGPVQIQVRVGNNVSNALPLTFSRVSEFAALATAIASFAVITAIVIWLLWKGVGTHTIGTRRYSPWTSFFLDKETNTYSLSKFQLLLWTAVFVFSYVYLFLCRVLIQWKFGLPPVPENLPGMLAISAGASVVSVGVTETRGSKGSGAVYPSAADFVSTGGLVVGERFQFFVWTVVGAAQFVTMILMTDPSTLLELPPIPANFLYLMGISSAGYLAGKVIRKPGPVVKAVTVSAVSPPAPPNPATMILLLQGENLSDSAAVKVDDRLLDLNAYAISGKKPQDQPPDPSFNNEVEVVLKNADDYLAGEHVVTLINRDGQVAAISFPPDPLIIDSIEDVPNGGAPVEVTVTGKNFSVGMTGTWKDPAGQETEIPADGITRKSATKLGVTITPGEKPGVGTLTLASSSGLTASKPCKVT